MLCVRGVSFEKDVMMDATPLVVLVLVLVLVVLVVGRATPTDAQTDMEHARRRRGEHRTCASTAWCVATIASLASSASVVTWMAHHDDDDDGTSTHRRGRWYEGDLGSIGAIQGATCACAIVAIGLMYVMHVSDPGVVIPSERDDDASVVVRRLDDAIARAMEVKTAATTTTTTGVENEESPENAMSYVARLEACVTTCVEADEDARALGLTRDFGGTWTRLASIEDEGGDGSRRIKFCSSCALWRPLCASHCSMCGVCVRGFDHHCGVLANCVGEANHRFFLLLLVTGAVAGVLVFIQSVFTLSAMPEGEWRSSAWPYVLVFCSLSGAHAFGMVIFAWSHVNLFLLGITTKQYLTREREDTIFTLRRKIKMKSVRERCCGIPMRSKRAALDEFQSKRLTVSRKELFGNFDV